MFFADPIKLLQFKPNLFLEFGIIIPPDIIGWSCISKTCYYCSWFKWGSFLLPFGLFGKATKPLLHRGQIHEIFIRIPWINGFDSISGLRRHLLLCICIQYSVSLRWRIIQLPTSGISNQSCQSTSVCYVDNKYPVLRYAVHNNLCLYLSPVTTYSSITHLLPVILNWLVAT